ncbi:hypothetical protein F8388_012749 [Cannabis sativa]|uniref:Rx N-terminal domain-containing protein n=1 Tax=Cannabis sativa TaxID=3483 RepID=A0A7J6HAG4_CANSA|nr:hypothetical protein F8388_012749 [Cannabis sativa]
MSLHSTALIMANLAYTIARNVLDKLGSLAYEEVSLAWGMKQDLDKLKLITLAIQDQEKNPQLKNWLNHLKDVFHDAVDVLNEFECELLRRQVVKQHASFGRKVCRFFSGSNFVVYHFSAVHRVKEIRQQLDETAKNMETFHLIKTQLNVEQISLVLENRVMTHSFVNPSDVIGRDLDPDENYFEMWQEFRGHDLIHNLACSITQNECSIVNSNDDREIFDTVRYLRVVINENNLKKLSKLKKLKSIHVKRTGDEKDEVVQSLPHDLMNCTALRSLLIGDCDQLNLASEFVDKDLVNEKDSSQQVKSIQLYSALYCFNFSSLMADLAYTIAGNVLDKLGSLAYQEVSLAWGMKQDLDKLKLITLALQDVLLDAETKQEKNPQLKNWLCHLKDVFHEAVDVLDEFECELLRRQVVKQYGSSGRKVCRFFHGPILFVVHRVKEIRQQFDEIVKNMEKFHLIKTQLNMDQNPHSFVNPSDVIGRDREKEEIMVELEDIGRSYFLELWGTSFFQANDFSDDDFEINQNFRVHDLIHDLACSITQTQRECSIVSSNIGEISDSIRYLRIVINENNLTKLSKLKKLRSIHIECTGDENDEVVRILGLTTKQSFLADGGIGRLKSLRFLGFKGCENLKALPHDLRNCTTLRVLLILNCKELELASEFVNEDVQLSLQTFAIDELILSSYKRKTDGIHNTIQKHRRVSLEN